MIVYKEYSNCHNSSFDHIVKNLSFFNVDDRSASYGQKNETRILQFDFCIVQVSFFTLYFFQVMS